MGSLLDREWFSRVPINITQLKDPAHPFDPMGAYVSSCGECPDIWKTELANRRVWTQFPRSYHNMCRFVNLTDYTYTVLEVSDARDRDCRNLTLVIPHKQVKGVTSYQSITYDKALVQLCEYSNRSNPNKPVWVVEYNAGRHIVAVFIEGATLRCLMEHSSWRPTDKLWVNYRRLQEARNTRRKLCALLPPRS